MESEIAEVRVQKAGIGKPAVDFAIVGSGHF
jgi:hypothetical protein